MQAQDVKDVLILQVLLTDHGHDAVGRDPNALAALINWKSDSKGVVPNSQSAPAPAKTKPSTKAPVTEDEPAF